MYKSREVIQMTPAEVATYISSLETGARLIILLRHAHVPVIGNLGNVSMTEGVVKSFELKKSIGGTLIIYTKNIVRIKQDFRTNKPYLDKQP